MSAAVDNGGMPLAYTQLTVSDSAAIADCMLVLTETDDQDHPEQRSYSLETLTGGLIHPGVVRKREWFVAYDGDVPVGNLQIEMNQRENRTALWFLLKVRPQFRRRGIGRQLHDFVVGYAAANERTVLQTECAWNLPGVPESDEAPKLFAEAMGYTPALPEVSRRLLLSEVDQDRLDAMVSTSDGYRTLLWRDRAPEEYVADVAYLDSRLFLDAPTGGLTVEPPQPDVSRLREIEEAQAARGRRNYHAGAVHVATNRLVAWTTITKAPGLLSAYQQITIVDPEHRGHRLGALIKVANLRQLMSAELEVESVFTGNAAANTYMIAINEELGFRPVRGYQELELELEL